MIEALCLQIEKIIDSNEPSLNPGMDELLQIKLNELTECFYNQQSNFASLFDRISQLEAKKCTILANKVKNVCILLELKLLLQGNDDQKLADWIVGRKDKIDMPEDSDKRNFFYALDEARERLNNRKLLTPEVGNALSKLVVTTLGVDEKKYAENVHTILSSIFRPPSLDEKDPNHLKALAHWINAAKFPLEKTNLKEAELNSIACYLHFVDARYLFLEIKLFPNAYELHIQNTSLSELKGLPPHLRVLNCGGCENLTALDLSLYPDLTELNCSCCTFTTLDLSKNTKLQKLDCSFCPFENIDLSKNTQLQSINCMFSSIKALDLSQNLQLQKLNFKFCPIESLDLSQNLFLRKIICHGCPLETLDLSQNLQLESVECNRCDRLTSLGESLANTLSLLECQECPRLSQLPQLPAAATVHSRDSCAGEIHSFKVYPAEIEEKPKQVLIDLGEILLANRPMPNIIYMDPATQKPSVGIDAGGLRRQFVATLCENLFKEGSGFDFVKDGDYTIPNSTDVDALRTFARLLGLKIPTGTNLHPSFFYSLFVLSDEELKHSPLPEPLLKKLYMARHGLDHFGMSDKVSMAEESNSLAAIAIIAKELRELLGAHFRTQNIEEFITKVQGIKATKETLKETIVCNNSQYKKWIDKFVDKRPERELKYFVMLLTGSYTLSQDKITFEVFPDRKYSNSDTVIHTCARIMELPSDFNEVQLHKELEAQLKLLKIFNTV